jgi:hypothetical protein
MCCACECVFHSFFRRVMSDVVVGCFDLGFDLRVRWEVGRGVSGVD